MNDIQPLTATQRSDFNGLLDHADNIGSSIVDPGIIDSYKKKVNPETTLTPDHIPTAIGEIDSLKQGNPIAGMSESNAAYLKSGMSDSYVFNPYNLKYPESRSHGTNLEGHIAENNPINRKMSSEK